MCVCGCVPTGNQSEKQEAFVAGGNKTLDKELVWVCSQCDAELELHV